MSRVELKELARDHTPSIKFYYMKSRAELISLLTMKDFPIELLNEKKTIHVLRSEARDLGIVNVWKLRRHKLLQLLYPSPKQHDENN